MPRLALLTNEDAHIDCEVAVQLPKSSNAFALCGVRTNARTCFVRMTASTVSISTLLGGLSPMSAMSSVVYEQVELSKAILYRLRRRSSCLMCVQVDLNEVHVKDLRLKLCCSRSAEFLIAGSGQHCPSGFGQFDD